jgi:hypothetical protein
LLGDINILVRPHPYNCHEWQSDPLADMPGVAVYPRRGYNPIDEENRADFFDSIFHAAAVVGINTSAMIEAAIIGRPVFSVMADEFSGTQEGTIHFHYLLPEHGGCVRFATTLEEHSRQLAERLRHPEEARAETQRFVASFIRPHGIERPATPIFADTIEALQRRPAPSPTSVAPWALVLRPVLLAAAAPAGLVSWLARSSTARARRSVARRR